MEHVKCNLCGKDDTKLLFTLYGLNVVKCKGCSLEYVNPRLSDEELQKIYNENYYDNPDFYSEEDGKHYGYDHYFQDKDNIQLNFVKRISRIGKLMPGKGKFLDVGCAAGFVLDLARKDGWEVYGVDLSAEAIEYGKNELGLNVQQKILSEAGFEDEFFDVVTILDVIEHLPDPRNEIKEMAKVLKKDGLLVVTTPNVGSLVPKIIGKHWLEYKRVREHIYFFSNKTLRKMLEGEGFKVVRTETTGRVFELHKLLEMATLQSRLFKLPYNLVKNNFIGRIRIPFNPLYKTTMYAVKR